MRSQFLTAQAYVLLIGLIISFYIKLRSFFFLISQYIGYELVITTDTSSITKIIFQILNENKEEKTLHKSIQKRPIEKT